jgi:hypothetical protein
VQTGTMKAIRKPGSDVLGTDFKLAYAEKGLTVETQPALKKVSSLALMCTMNAGFSTIRIASALSNIRNVLRIIFEIVWGS